MDLAAFRRELRQKGKIQPAYLFSGEQDLLKAEAVEELRRAVGGARGAVRSFSGGGADAQAIFEVRQNLSLLDPVAVIVVRQAARLGAAAREQLADDLAAAGAGPPVVFWDETFDRRIRLFGAIAKAGGEVEFTTPKRGELAAWVRAEAQRLGHAIDGPAIEELIDLVGDDLLRLRSTLERVSIGIGAGARIDLEALAEHVASTRLHAIYELQGAVTAREAARAVGVYRRLLDEGEEVPGLVGALFAEIRRLLLAREADGGDLARLLEVPPFRAQKIEEASRRFSSAELRRAIDRLADIDVASKTGRGDAQAALERWLIALCERPAKEARGHA